MALTLGRTCNHKSPIVITLRSRASGMWPCVAWWMGTNVSMEPAGFIFRTEESTHLQIKRRYIPYLYRRNIIFGHLDLFSTLNVNTQLQLNGRIRAEHVSRSICTPTAYFHRRMYCPEYFQQQNYIMYIRYIINNVATSENLVLTAKTFRNLAR
jgi:hypothetical protein